MGVLPDSSDGYSVRGVYDLLITQDIHIADSAVELIRHNQVPLKVSIFAWRLICDHLPTKSNLAGSLTFIRKLKVIFFLKKKYIIFFRGIYFLTFFLTSKFIKDQKSAQDEPRSVNQRLQRRRI